MGGTPTAALITLGLPQKFETAFVEGLYEGINALARRHAVAIAGGETTASPGQTFISVSLVGAVDQQRWASRAGAKAGDAIFVTGELGGSIDGRHLEFEPRLAEGQWLVSNFQIHAMIDVSDGLAGDLRHVLQRSGVGAELLSSSIPISRAAKLRARQESSAKPPLLSALTDGEDFELLFTLASARAVALLDQWKVRFPDVPLTCIGRITESKGLKLRDKEGLREFGLRGFDHFSQTPGAQ